VAAIAAFESSILTPGFDHRADSRDGETTTVPFEPRLIITQGISRKVLVDRLDESKSLTGVCDFLLTASTNQVVIDAPVVAIVEAKDNDIRSVLGQCAAEMFAACIFNDRQGHGDRMIWGAVTTGTNWRFLRLQGGQNLEVDLSEYSISQLPQVLGILAQPFKESAVAA